MWPTLQNFFVDKNIFYLIYDIQISDYQSISSYIGLLYLLGTDVSWKSNDILFCIPT